MIFILPVGKLDLGEMRAKSEKEEADTGHLFSEKTDQYLLSRSRLEGRELSLSSTSQHRLDFGRVNMPSPSSIRVNMVTLNGYRLNGDGFLLVNLAENTIFIALN